jgi:PAS domain S-box-containing protein
VKKVRFKVYSQSAVDSFYKSLFDSPYNAEIFNCIFEITSEAVWILDIDGNRTLWLASDENKIKYALRAQIEEGLQNDHWEKGLHPEDKQYAIEGFQTARDNPTLTLYEHNYRFRGADDQYYFILDRIKFLRDSKGVAKIAVGVWTDVSDQKFREEKLEALLQSMEDDRERFRIISEVSNAAMWEVDFVSDRIYWTAGNETLKELGLASPNYTLDDWVKAIHPEDRERAAKTFADAVESGSTKFCDEYRIVKPDGSIAHVFDQGYIVRDANGKPVRSLGGWIDVTSERCRELELEEALERHERMNEELSAHEEELASSEEELRQINEQLSVNLQILTERDFIISQSQKLAKIGSWEFEPYIHRMTWSNEMYSIFGVDRSFNASNFIQLLEDNSAPLISAAFQKIIDGDNTPFDFTAQVKTPLGYRKWVRLTGYPILDDDRLARIIGLTYDITYFKESEERLKTSEEKFSKAFRNNPDLMNIVREDNKMILDVNERAFEMLGYHRHELIGTLATELNLYVYPNQREYFYKEYNLSGQVDMEATWRKRDGSHIQVLVSTSRLELEGHKCMLSVVRDISDRKIAEEKFEKAFELSPDLMLIFREEDSVLVAVNSKQQEFSGYSREETIGKSSKEFQLWAIDEQRKAFFERYFVEGFATGEAMFLKKGNVPFFGTISAQRIQLGNANHILIVVRDITDKKLSEEKLIASEANLSATINNTEFLIWSVDREYKILKFNEPFKKYSKEVFDIDLMVGNGILDHPWMTSSGDIRLIWKERYNRALAGETVKISDTRDGRYLDISLNPIIDNGKVMGASVFAEDVSERVEKEKELAEALNKIGELKLMALRSVMNPHFIFNALNSIQFFIAQNDRKNAINYLSTFSKLVRGILTHSVNNKIKLSEELDQLKHYVALEQMRFENKFDFEVHLDEALDLDTIEIPSLLVQPYVENAILHGLYNKEGRGILKINVREEDDTILFEIEDDGIGRKAAMDLRNQNFPKHKSMGTALTEERLKLINAQDKVSFEIIDLLNQDHVPCGTKVKIWVKE